MNSISVSNDRLLTSFTSNFSMSSTPVPLFSASSDVMESPAYSVSIENNSQDIPLNLITPQVFTESAQDSSKTPDAESAMDSSLNVALSMSGSGSFFVKACDAVKSKITSTLENVGNYFIKKEYEGKDYEPLDSSSEEVKKAFYKIGEADGFYRAEKYLTKGNFLEKPEVTELGLTPSDLLGITYYTSSGYSVLNKALREKDSSVEAHNDYVAKSPVVDYVISGLEKLPSYEGTVFRGLTLKPEQLEEYTVGATIENKAFTSTSKENDLSFSGNVVLTLDTCANSKGKDIEWISVYGDTEKEVLFLPETNFVVISRTDENLSTKIYMQELPA